MKTVSNKVRHSLAYLSVQKRLVGDVPLNVGLNFALSEPVLGVAAVLVSAFTKF